MRLLLGIALIAAATMPASRPFTFDDYYRIVNVESAQISPDGTQIAVVVSQTNVAHDDSTRRLLLLGLDGSSRDITAARSHVQDPRWSPDGTRLAFIADAGSGTSAKPQVWIVSPPDGAATAFTSAKNGVQSFAWRPDSAAIAYETDDDTPHPAERNNDLFTVGDQSYLIQSKPVSTHLWLQAFDAGVARRLTHGSWSLNGHGIPSDVSWSPDGKYIAFTYFPNAYHDSLFFAHVAVLNVATGRIRILDRHWSWLPRFAPQSDTLAWTTATHGTPALMQDLVVERLGSPVAQSAAPRLDRGVEDFAWLANGRGFVLAADDRVWTPLWRVHDGAAARLDTGDISVNGLSASRSGAVAFTGQTSRDPGEVYYLAPGATRPRRLTSYNAGIASLDLGRTREFIWHRDGFLEDGVLTYPVGYVQGKKYPLVLVIHGGPTLEISTTSFYPLVQILAAHGFVVFQPNYRGSDSFGYRYADAIFGPDQAAVAASDCVAGVLALERTGMVDSSRIGVSGWSAGGWMTSYLIGNYTMWKAAVTGASVEDLVLSYTMSEIPAYTPMSLGGVLPWTPRGLEIYRRNSPLTYVHNVRTPTLILSDTMDPRVPTPESYEYYIALRDLGRTVKFIEIPAYGHHPGDPVRNRAIDRVWAAWMERYLRP